MGLIGRDGNFVGQILIVLGVKRRTRTKREKGGCSINKSQMSQDMVKIHEMG